jgi:hypothetical protein
MKVPMTTAMAAPRAGLRENLSSNASFSSDSADGICGRTCVTADKSSISESLSSKKSAYFIHDKPASR